jgi:hypothetical protein
MKILVVHVSILQELEFYFGVRVETFVNFIFLESL